MGQPLNRLTLRGFKSIESLEDFELRNLNVLIGANGAGKSNFVDFFRMLRALANEGFQRFVNLQGGGGCLFFLGPNHTRRISAHVEVGENVYEFDLGPTANGGVQIEEERAGYVGRRDLGGLMKIGSGGLESVLKKRREDAARLPWGKGRGVPPHLFCWEPSWVVYHFHDTSIYAPMRRDQFAHDTGRLREDASNIAAYLLGLRHDKPDSYNLIRESVRLIAPFFDDFLLEPQEVGREQKLFLKWKQKGTDFPFFPSQLSDGMIRYICLATALQQPQPPSTIVVDEPELGLHPLAISLLAELIQAAAERTQVIVSTQSPLLLDHFQPEDTIIVNRKEGRTILERLDATRLTEWREEYSLGEMWQKNVVQAGPTYG